MAKKRGGARPIITLACNDCRQRNYTSVKNQRSDPQRLELSKYCPSCRQHRSHREVR